MDDRLRIGCVVYSKKGRDSGKFFVVVDVDDNYVYLSDGNIHKLSNPKKKNIKHVRDTGNLLPSIANKLFEKKKVFDSELNSALRAYNENGGNECQKTM